MPRLRGLGSGLGSCVAFSLLSAQAAWAAEADATSVAAAEVTAAKDTPAKETPAKETPEWALPAASAPPPEWALPPASAASAMPPVSASLDGIEPDALTVARLGAIAPQQRTPAQWLRLARAYVRLGQLVAAGEAYAWLPRGAVPEDVERERERVASLVPQLQIRVDGAHSNARVFVDTQSLHTDQLGQAQQLDPGWHVVLLEEHGKVTDARRLFVGEGARDVVVLTATSAWPALGSSQVLQETAARDPLPYTTLPDTPVDAEASGSWLPTYLSLTVSAAAGITAGVFFIRGLSSAEELEPAAPCFIRSFGSSGSPGATSVCPSSPARASAEQRADRNMKLAGVSALVSLLGVGSALTLWALHEDAEQPQAQVRVGLGEVAVSGTF